MIKTSVILFVLFYLVSAQSQQTIDKLNSNQLKLPKETISKALSIDATGQVKSSSTSSVELGYLSGVSSNVQDQINDKVNDADAVHLTGDESVAGVKTLTGKLVTSSTVNASIPCPVMTQTQRDAIAIPMVGDCVFNSDTSLSNIYDGSLWKAMGGSGGGIGLWVTANGYAVDDVVIESNNIYICLTAHTSGTFATDLASLYWLRLSTDVTGATGLLPLATGGTNKSITPVDGSIIYSDIDSLELLGPGTSGQILQSNGSAAPSWGDKTDYSVTNALETSVGTNQVLLETGNKNILTNPSFEHSTFDSGGWVNSAGSFTENFTFKIDGAKSARLVLSSQTMSLTQSSVLYQSNFADGVQGIATVRVKSSVALKVCSIQAGTVSSTNCVTTATDLKWGLYKVPFILGATSNGISIASSGNVSGTVYIDDAFVGVTDIAQISSAIGPVTNFTPTGSWVPVTYSGKWHREGEFAVIEFNGVLTGVPTGMLTLNIPSSIGTIDLTKTSSTPTTASSDVSFSNLSAIHGGSYYVGSSSSISVRAWVASSTYTQHADIIPTIPFTWASGHVFRVEVKVPITQFSGSVSTYSTPSDSFSTDSNTLTHKTTAIVASDAIGTYNTYSYAINTNTKTICGTAPTALPSSANGFLIFTRAYNSASNCGNPARIEIKIGAAGDKFPTIKTDIYKSSGKVTSGSITGFVQSAGAQAGLSHNSYDETTGVLILDAGVNELASITSRYFIFSDVSSQTSGFLVINAQKAKDFVVGQFNGLQSCTDTLACTDTFSFQGSTSSTVSNENVDWINGNGSGATGVYDYPVKSGIFTANPNCTCTAVNPTGASVDSVCTVTSASPTYISVRTTVANVLANINQSIICQKQGADYIGKTAMAVASDQNVRSIGSTGVDIQSVYFGSGANCTSPCITTPCSMCTKVGSKITSVTRDTVGVYRINGIDGVSKYNCSGSNGYNAGIRSGIHVIDASNSTSAQINYYSTGTTLSDVGYTNVTCLGIP